jgi:hypothetical protein
MKLARVVVLYSVGFADRARRREFCKQKFFFFEEERNDQDTRL